MSGAVPEGARPAPTLAVAPADAGARVAITARVLEVSAQGALIATGRARWLLALPQNAPAVQAGSTLRLALPTPPGATGAQARLLAIDGRALQPPLPIELRAAPPGASTPATPRDTSGPAPTAPPTQMSTRALLSAFAGRPELPRPDAQLAARVLQLLGWLEAGPDTPSARGARDLRPGAALAGALAELARQAQELLPGGWRVHVLPLGGGQEVQELRLYVRGDERHPGRDEPEGHPRDHDDPPRRAIFEVEFSRLGRCQIDALCQARRFDLVLRTAAPLDPALRREIAAIFAAACEVGRLAGGIGFGCGELLRLPSPPGPAARAITV